MSYSITFYMTFTSVNTNVISVVYLQEAAEYDVKQSSQCKKKIQYK